MLGMAAILAHPGTSIDPPTLPISKLAFIVRHLGHANKLTAILSYTSLAVLIAARIVKQAVAKRPGGTWVRFVPEILVVVVGTTGMVVFYQAENMKLNPRCSAHLCLSLGQTWRRGSRPNQWRQRTSLWLAAQQEDHEILQLHIPHSVRQRRCRCGRLNRCSARELCKVWVCRKPKQRTGSSW